MKNMRKTEKSKIFFK